MLGAEQRYWRSLPVKRILVLGGYGNFGGRIVEILAREGHDIIVGGRRLALAEAFCRGRPRLTPLAVERNGDLGDVLRAVKPWLVVDAVGPFQTADYRVVQACIKAGCHYIDIADARAFVTDIGALDAMARAAGVSVIAGASSVPALSSAVADELAAGMTRVAKIDTAISASNRATVGVSVIAAILSYVGRPITLWRGGRERIAFGWQDMVRRCFAVRGCAPIDDRLVALCDVPDLAVLPERYPGRPAVIFRAGAESAAQNRLLWLLSWPVRWGWLDSLAPLAALVQRAQCWTARWGSDRSAMLLRVSGFVGDMPVERSWTLIAEQGDGPWVPCLAVPLLVERLMAGDLPVGAKPAVGLVRLEDFERLFAHFALRSERCDIEYVPLYRQVMGARFDQLPPAVADMHRLVGEATAHGRATIRRGAHPLARLVAKLMGFPPAASDIPVSVWFDAAQGRETWERDFDGHRFRSHLCRRGGLLVERFGLLRFGFDLQSEPNGLSMRLRRWWLGPLPLPIMLAPRGIAQEATREGRFHFDVPIKLPLIGLIVHYSGWLELSLHRADSSPM